MKRIQEFQPTSRDRRMVVAMTPMMSGRADVLIALLFGAVSWGLFGWLLSIAVQSLHNVDPPWFVSAIKFATVCTGLIGFVLLRRTFASKRKVVSIIGFALCIPAIIVVVGAFSILLRS